MLNCLCIAGTLSALDEFEDQDEDMENVDEEPMDAESDLVSCCVKQQ